MSIWGWLSAVAPRQQSHGGDQSTMGTVSLAQSKGMRELAPALVTSIFAVATALQSSRLAVTKMVAGPGVVFPPTSQVHETLP